MYTISNRVNNHYSEARFNTTVSLAEGSDFGCYFRQVTDEEDKGTCSLIFKLWGEMHLQQNSVCGSINEFIQMIVKNANLACKNLP